MNMLMKNKWFSVLVLTLPLISCGALSGGAHLPPPASAASATIPAIGHVVVVMEENHPYDGVISNSSAPYLNSLAAKYSLATQYFADTHPSIGNYFMLTTGQIVTNDDTFTGTVNVDNLARRLIAAGKTWKSYAESLPSVGYTGGDSGPYLKRHNPLSYFTDVVGSSTQSQNLVPFTQFSQDIAASTLPNFSFVIPNANNDAHDGSLAVADSWLQTNIAPLLASPQFQQDGLLIVVFDESDTLDFANGGGHVAAVLVGTKVMQTYRSATFFQHESTLNLIFQALGLSSSPGKAATAPSMAEFFQQ
jgi:phosphatidylinositol-3-phosphatase